jgi:bifunctional oligoribonuclease and PAP phosphatase NrnA
VGDWRTNTTLDELATTLRSARRVVVSTHLKPDGDAVGSSLAITRALNLSAWGGTAGVPRAEAWYSGPQPPWLDAIAGTTPRRVVDKDSIPNDDGRPVDAVVITDTGSWSQLEPISEWLAPRREMTMVVDHHVQGDPDTSARRFVETSAAAACQPMAELCRRVLGLSSIAALPKAVAEPLYLGLCTDTGWFRHSNVDAGVMRTAGELLSTGVEHYPLYREIEQRETLPRLRLLGRALESIEMHLNDRLAVITLRRRDFEETRAATGDAGGFTDFTQMMPQVEVTAILTEALPAEYGLPTDSGPITKVSMRSKAGGAEIDVNRIAKALSGGGHVRAAGARMQGPLDQTKASIIRLVGEQLNAATAPSGPR